VSSAIVANSRNMVTKMLSIILVSATMHEDENTTEYVYLLKSDSDEYYLVRTIHGWVQISDIQKNLGRLASYEYYVDKTVVPLLYYILVTNPRELDEVFEFFTMKILSHTRKILSKKRVS